MNETAGRQTPPPELDAAAGSQLQFFASGDVELQVLLQLSQALSLTGDLDRRMRLLLTALTMGSGFRFNRAMLLLAAPEGGDLVGRMAIGPASMQEAGEIWQRLSRDHLDREDWFRRILEEPTSVGEELDRRVRALRLPRDAWQGPIAAALADGHVRLGRPSDHLPAVLAALGETSARSEALVIIPLVEGPQVLGVIMVDSPFSERPVTPADLQFLGVFASIAKLAVESDLRLERLKQVNQELERTRERLIQQERNATMGEMSYSLAHELRHPLVGIGAYARKLRDILKEGREARYAGRILDEVIRLEGTLEEILEVARSHREQMDRTDLNGLLGSAMEALRLEMEARGIETRLELAADLPSVLANGSAIRRVMDNLLINAMEAMPGGGLIVVRTSPAGKDEVAFEIADTGPGIPPEDLRRVFNPFFTRKQGGTGLGLPLVHKIVADHGGRVNLKRMEGYGAVFEVILPVTPAGPAASS